MEILGFLLACLLLGLAIRFPVILNKWERHRALRADQIRWEAARQGRVKDALAAAEGALQAGYAGTAEKHLEAARVACNATYPKAGDASIARP